ncbi:MAG: DUF2267 domain-containing protein [Saccharopolyspora sp.]|uniref:DUF2267 domain-containing protein n=1 Tax=Saccharopolyspora sp. TaxID=33915 RepID=UPI0025FC3ED5|nr:DUF2267 domain-containing protein [Saccharopolyspora sp.]MBQ6643393.1 DUF2267 domain-containing protein [Saccharopolyspora sp.]
MNYDEFLATVRRRTALPDNAEAEQTTRIVLSTLGQRLAGQEPRDLADQLPEQLKDPLLERTGSAENRDDFGDFLERIADQEGPNSNPDLAREHAHAVVGTMAQFVSRGELEDLRSQLPSSYAPLFG